MRTPGRHVSAWGRGAQQCEWGAQVLEQVNFVIEGIAHMCSCFLLFFRGFTSVKTHKRCFFGCTLIKTHSRYIYAIWRVPHNLRNIKSPLPLFMDGCAKLYIMKHEQFSASA